MLTESDVHVQVFNLGLSLADLLIGLDALMFELFGDSLYYYGLLLCLLLFISESTHSHT